jgi:hypothetical protein
VITSQLSIKNRSEVLNYIAVHQQRSGHTGMLSEETKYLNSYNVNGGPPLLPCGNHLHGGVACAGNEL